MVPSPAATRGERVFDIGRQLVGEHARVQFEGLAVGVQVGARKAGAQQGRAHGGRGGKQLVDEKLSSDLRRASGSSRDAATNSGG